MLQYFRLDSIDNFLFPNHHFMLKFPKITIVRDFGSSCRFEIHPEWTEQFSQLLKLVQ